MVASALWLGGILLLLLLLLLSLSVGRPILVGVTLLVRKDRIGNGTFRHLYKNIEMFDEGVLVPGFRHTVTFIVVWNQFFWGGLK